MAMELTGVFYVPEHARTAIDLLKRSGYDVDSAAIVTGADARERLDRFVVLERWERIASGALGCGALALIIAALQLPPVPYNFPWVAVMTFAAASALLGAVAGAYIGTNVEEDSVLLELTVPKDHLNEVMHIFRMAGGRRVNATSVSSRSSRLTNERTVCASVMQELTL